MKDISIYDEKVRKQAKAQNERKKRNKKSPPNKVRYNVSGDLSKGERTSLRLQVEEVIKLSVLFIRQFWEKNHHQFRPGYSLRMS